MAPKISFLEGTFGFFTMKRQFTIQPAGISEFTKFTTTKPEKDVWVYTIFGKEGGKGSEKVIQQVRYRKGEIPIIFRVL